MELVSSWESLSHPRSLQQTLRSQGVNLGERLCREQGPSQSVSGAPLQVGEAASLPRAATVPSLRAQPCSPPGSRGEAASLPEQPLFRHCEPSPGHPLAAAAKGTSPLLVDRGDGPQRHEGPWSGSQVVCAGSVPRPPGLEAVSVPASRGHPFPQRHVCLFFPVASPWPSVLRGTPAAALHREGPLRRSESEGGK